MTVIDLEAEYNNRARVPEHPAIIAGWARDAALWREERATSLAVHAYGPSARQTLALFRGEGRGLPVLFVHGGYWQALDPSFFSHMARGLNLRGHDVAIMGYDLCPEVTLADIVAQAGAAATLLAQLAGRRVVITGHSAGGHLAACLTADPALPVAAGLAISGLFELEPLVPTSVNAKLGLDLAEARRLSPRLGPAPPAGRPFDAWVGGRESAEYLRQSRGIAAVWAACGVPTRFEAVPDADHFTVIAGLADPDDRMTARLAELAER